MRKLNPRRVIWFKQGITCKELKTQGFLTTWSEVRALWKGGSEQIPKWSEPCEHVENKYWGSETGKGKCLVLRVLDKQQDRCGQRRTNWKRCKGWGQRDRQRRIMQRFLEVASTLGCVLILVGRHESILSRDLIWPDAFKKKYLWNEKQ